MGKGLVTKTFEFQIRELEAGISRCEENIRVFQSEVYKEQRELPLLEQQLDELKAGLSKLEGDELELQKRKILALEDNIARCKKNIEIYSQEVEKQQNLRFELQIELQRLKIEQEKTEKQSETKNK